MTEGEKRIEVKRLLLFIYQEWNKPITEDLVSYWLNSLRGFTGVREAWVAAKFLVRSKTYGEPKLRDLCEVIMNLRKCLRRAPYQSEWDLKSPDLPSDIRFSELRKEREHEASQAVPVEISDYVRELSNTERAVVLDYSKRGELALLPSPDEAKAILGRVAPKLLKAS